MPTLEMPTLVQDVDNEGSTDDDGYASDDFNELLLPFPARLSNPPTLFPTALYPPQPSYQMWDEPSHNLVAPSHSLVAPGSNSHPSIVLGFNRTHSIAHPNDSPPPIYSRKNLAPPAGFQPYSIKDTREGLFTATYAGVHVWELNLNGVGVMRRQHDDWINATHILKAGGIDKGKRTKLLDKELDGADHQKIQGGFGRFQGTWVNLEKARELATMFGVYDKLEPILRTSPVEDKSEK